MIGMRTGIAILLAGGSILGCTQAPETAGSRAKRFVYVSPDPLGINPFLIMGETGIERAAAQHGAEAQVLESEDPTTREEPQAVVKRLDMRGALPDVLSSDGRSA